MYEICKRHYSNRWKKTCLKIQQRRCIALLMSISFGIVILCVFAYIHITASDILPIPSVHMVLYRNRSTLDNISYVIETTSSLQSMQSNHFLFATGETGTNSKHLKGVEITILPEISKVSTYGFSVTAKVINNPKPEMFKETHFMTISGNGRLGNNMFQVAALLSCAKQLNYTAFLPPDHKINQYFLFPFTSTMSLINVKIAVEKAFGKYDRTLESLDTSKNWSLAGYYQSWKYFYKDEGLIRGSFKFRPKLYEPARQIVNSFRSENRTVVGIHIRRRDMITHSAEAAGYSAAPISYIKKSIKYFKEKYSGTFFIVVSDDIPWCKGNLQEDNGTAFISFDNPGTDMAILSVCDHVIITSGTFGWWGAWLAGGDVVYFKDYPKPGSPLDKQISREDYYPPHWIGLD